MAIEAELIGGLPELSVIAGALHVVAVKAGDPSAIHHRLHKIVALHAILVCGAVWVVEEIRGLAKSMLLQLPIIRQPHSYVIANGPIVVLALNWI